MRRVIYIMILVFLSTIAAQGQIKIGGNVYGGGNKGNVKGSTNVTVKRGDINQVFGGARQANVGGNTYVNIDGANATGYTLINYVYGGNDIAGTIGTAQAVGETLPKEIKNNTDGVDDTWNTYVHISTKEENEEKIFIGQAFAGGNGDYVYPPADENGNYVVNKVTKTSTGTVTTTVATNSSPFVIPELDKTYIDIQGGTIIYAYGGGNNATVKEKTVIHVDNPGQVVNELWIDADGNEKTSESESGTYTNVLDTSGDRVNNQMGAKTAQEHIESADFQIGRLFGGNNKAEMAIMPTWNLQSGKIRNLYSGGNKGMMTSPTGLLLEIDPASTNTKPLVIDNVYGGCRMSDVKPTVNGQYVACTNLQDKDDQGNLKYKFPDGLAARVLVRGGDINNVYGGNDVTGTVYGGNAIGIYTNIRGNVYGGGNGSYAYTNKLKDDPVFEDFYYPIPEGKTSWDALNDFRPNAEQVSIRLKGTDADHPTIIQGAVFVGGNCATLKTTGVSNINDPLMELKIGSHVIADKLFLGNNGEGMVDQETLEYYADENFNNKTLLDLTQADVFAHYMDGVVIRQAPAIVFDETPRDPSDYISFSSKVGSFYCGGNVGSMAIGGKSTFGVDRGLVIFDKFVAGCNSADVEAQAGLNAAYEGGVLGSEDERGSTTSSFYTADGTEGGNILDRIELNLDSLKIEPRRWNDVFTQVTVKRLVADKNYYTSNDGAGSFIADGSEEVTEANQYYEKIGSQYVAVNPNTLNAGQVYYETDLRSSRFIADGTEEFKGSNDPETYYELTTVGTTLDWNTALWSIDEDDFMATDSTDTTNDRERRLVGGNVYGGCYNSGHVNGNVTININHELIQRNDIFAEVDIDNPYTIKEGGKRHSGVLREAQGDDLMALAMTVFGAGKGESTEIWGNTKVNLTNGYVFQVFGGGEEGVVGKKNSVGEYVFDSRYSSIVNLEGPNAGYAEKDTGGPLAETEYIYGGGNEGDVCGNSYVYLGNGRIYDAFGGASNADILGSTEVYIGHNGGFPWIKDNVYGGNDFGGSIKGAKNHSNVTSRTPLYPTMLESSTYVRYIQGRVDSIFGGNYGSYNYKNRIFKDYTDDDGNPLVENGEPIFSYPNQSNNSFVHFQPADESKNEVHYIFGGSEGFPGNVAMNNSMQQESYVLIDDTETRDANRFAKVDIYGGGSYAGVGIPEATGAGHTLVDLYAGNFHNIYGGSNKEGLIGYTNINVPVESTIKVNALFGGGKGYSTDQVSADPQLAARYCDNYITCIDYKGSGAIVNDAIYGGNENSRISCDTYINIEAPVLQSNGYQGYIYGAGYGNETVSGRTNVFMNNGSVAYKVFGGGRDGNAFNFASLKMWLGQQFRTGGTPLADLPDKVTEYGNILRTFGDYISGRNADPTNNIAALSPHPIHLPSNIGTYMNETTGLYDGTYTNDIMPTQEKPMPDYHQTNVHLMKGSTVTGYAYGGGFGSNAIVGGTTYVELKGGTVDRDIYGGGQGGSVFDEFELSKDNDDTNDFVAATNVYIEGGMARNVYGGGYLGHVGKHTKKVSNEEVNADISDPYTDDIPGVANITIGKIGANDFLNGKPAITRNAYGGGEGGSVWGTTNLTINNGMIGYRYMNTGTAQSPVYEYVEETEDGDQSIDLAGNAFGGGYVVNSYVDIANVNMYGGTLRGSLFGGGEVGPIGRGTMKNPTSYTTGLSNGDARIFKAGQTHVKMYNGLVKRNVFGGGRGKDSWGGNGTKYMRETMTAEEFDNLDLICKGYVFGQTDVNIYGGEIGTKEGMENENDTKIAVGNVFGGCDEGSVYSAYELNNNLYIGKKPTGSTRYDKGDEGYYYKYNGTSYVNDNGVAIGANDEKHLTEDCHVLVEPWLKVTADAGISYNNKTYAKGDYIPTAYLNTLGKKNKESGIWAQGWDNLDAGSMVGNEYVERGINIHNAVFAGGNIAKGSDMYANTNTVFGNATATIHDVYNRDLITIGTGHTGGLYGDGNLTLVDGYRELNITNYGTDYDNIKEEISYENFLLLPPREQAYYEIKYKCMRECTDNEGTTYTPGSSLPKDELLVLFENNSDIIQNGEPNTNYWTQNGVVSRYAGRIMNTIQRADFCGVFGSRMVMRGAKDRVATVEDRNNYTINRVREVSLNLKESAVPNDNSDFKTHGNYFGIYNVVNYLGALTSDVDFYSDIRKTDNSDDKYKETVNGKLYGEATYADWKGALSKDPRRNNGVSHNQVALASGVHLELTTEESTGNTLEEKVWGLITGVVELDLINVSNGIGGGYVYAKNVHGVRNPSGKTQTILTDLNRNGNKPAATNKTWKYVETAEGNAKSFDASQESWQTSGNFVHNTQIIVDDCHDESNRYLMSDPKRKPAHKWYIRGTVYYYDRYITAHTGSPNAYSEIVSLPITISAASHNKMKLLDVQPNYYAYYSTSGAPLTGDQKLVINDETYELNTPISYWDWSQLPKAERDLFVEETYITTDPCIVGTGTGKETYLADQVLLPEVYDRLYEKAVTMDVTDDNIDNPEKAVQQVAIDDNGNTVVVTDKDGNPVYVPFNSVFHSSNNISHTTGYVLTHELTNPGIWDQWYTKVSSATHEKNQTGGSNYEYGPTYHLVLDGDQSGKLLGQRNYQVNDIIPENVYTDYTTLQQSGVSLPAGQAEFVRAYVVTKECSDDTRRYYPGAPVSATQAETLGSSNAALAYVCTGSIQLSPTKYIFINDLLTEKEITQLKTTYTDKATEIDKLVVPAYYCSSAGLYGGKYYLKNNNYYALETISSMSAADREYFEFNYDALDLLIDPYYTQAASGPMSEGKKYQYDSADANLNGAEANAAHYSLSTPLEYSATYDGTTALNLGSTTINVTHLDGTPGTGVSTIVKGDELDDDTYESLINEQIHYAPIEVTKEDETFYVVKESFFYKEPYAVGQLIEKKTYDALPHFTGEGQLNLQQNVEVISFHDTGTYYYCRDPYTIATDGTAIKPLSKTTDNKYTSSVNTTANELKAGDDVPLGFIINQNGTGQNNNYKYGYCSLVNQQKGFIIHGATPTETITFLVNREADIDDLSKEKIITVVYQYDYEESDESGLHITPISERHVVRIHITFEDGLPVVEDIKEPDLVLPGTSIIMPIPGTSSEDVIVGGWELYADKKDAASHIKFKNYTPGSEPLYWYQDGFYIAYYAQTFTNKAYSNAVPVHVANYHDLKDVMDDKVNHLHVDYDRTRLQRDSKIYINDYSESNENGLDLFKSFYDLSTGTAIEGHTPLNISEAKGTNIYDGQEYKKGVKAGTNLEFFLRTDIDHGPTTNTTTNQETGETTTTTEDHPWTPIGTDSQCFMGTFHGDGHTISGLDNSLFYNLCGDVYNLGVTGKFNSAGVVDKGTGYVESVWVKTTNKTPVEGTKPYPVFGAPSDNNGYQVVNSYFWNDNSNLYNTTMTDGLFTYTNGSKGSARAMSSEAFYNGELAYDLNNFYLYKRYTDKKISSGSDLRKYSYFTVNDDNTLTWQKDHYYAADNEALCSSGFVDAKNNCIKYVEDRFADGDFRFAARSTVTQNEHYHVETETNPTTQEVTVKSTGWYPIWPDDYIFFGQKLTYGYSPTQAHQEVPTAVARFNGRLSQNEDANRVYRAPAYYGSNSMNVAHFNPDAYLAAKEKLTDSQKENGVTPRNAYPGMTAIDFAGHNESNMVNGNYGLGSVSNGSSNGTTWFYPPLLDDDGLLSIVNQDETKNLLVYAPANASDNGYANEKTYTVLNNYFKEPAFSSYYDEDDAYKRVGVPKDYTINGHLVQSSLTATNDHLLVDKEDFNAPIGYSFASAKRMWYQRTPANEEYVDRTKGWQGISIPFTAELVTTNQKGEITHFYNGSTTGHEYWLRSFTDIKNEGTAPNIVAKADFTYPSSNDGSVVINKNYTNTFLWDYYYKNPDIHNQKDKNEDTYLEYRQYYHEPHTYTSYPLLTAAKPYILGLPGPTYYEFDLSGNFEAQNTYADNNNNLDNPGKSIGRQTITFASAEGASIAVSDVEINEMLSAQNDNRPVHGGYAFVPSYMNKTLKAVEVDASGTPVSGDTTPKSFALNAEGSAYNAVTWKASTDAKEITVAPFRPYFTTEAAAIGATRQTRSIIFSNVSNDSFGPETFGNREAGTLSIGTGRKKIIVSSDLKEETTVQILTTTGITLTTFVIQPGETVETRVNLSGVYIVQTADGQFTKKQSVR